MENNFFTFSQKILQMEEIRDILMHTLYLKVYKDIRYDLQDTFQAMTSFNRTEQLAFVYLMRRLAENSVNRLLAMEMLDANSEIHYTNY